MESACLSTLGIMRAIPQIPNNWARDFHDMTSLKSASNALLIVLLGLQTLKGADLIVNGGFDGLVGPDVTLPAGSSAIQGWTVSQTGNVDWVQGWTAPDTHAFSLDLNGTAVGGIEQTFSTTSGQQYTVTFYMAGNNFGGPA